MEEVINNFEEDAEFDDTAPTPTIDEVRRDEEDRRDDDEANAHFAEAMCSSLPFLVFEDTSAVFDHYIRRQMAATSLCELHR